MLTGHDVFQASQIGKQPQGLECPGNLAGSHGRTAGNVPSGEHDLPRIGRSTLVMRLKTAALPAPLGRSDQLFDPRAPKINIIYRKESSKGLANANYLQEGLFQ